MTKILSLRSILFAAIAFGLLLVTACDLPKPARPLVEPGETVPEMNLFTPSGEEVRISEVIGGKVALVDVWATWCAPCIAAMPHLQALHNRYKDRGFTVVGIMTDGNASSIAEDYLAKKKASYPMLVDEDGAAFMSSWGQIAGIPLLVLVDSDGRVLETYQGIGDLNELDRRLEEVFVGMAPISDEEDEAAEDTEEGETAETEAA